MSVLNNANKQMLLELCDSNGITTTDGEFRLFFDRLCINYNTNRLEYNNIQEINKKILEECFYYSQKLNEAKESMKKRQEPIRRQVSNQTTELKTLDSTDLRIQKDSEFTMKLKSREDAFQSLLNKPAPPQVTFEEKEQDEPSKNLDVLMNQSLADREKELQIILNTTSNEKAKEWLSSVETSENPKSNKKVTFQIEEHSPTNERQEVVNLLSKLKPKSNDNTEIINLLKKVLENQEKILNKLNKEETEITAMLED
ncbi:MAG: hypothetical protein CXT73_04885 [Methanobacteriota archaeon]|nr:MAG: hypothetical protein CXT73_04885 [Euryarchaeota archaeon]